MSVVRVWTGASVVRAEGEDLSGPGQDEGLIGPAPLEFAVHSQVFHTSFTAVS